MSALGLIETKGLVAAIEAADTMVKSADVHIIERHQVGGGLVTITVTGEVSAVNAAVDAAIVAVGRIDGAELISSHVIARPYEEVSNLIVMEKEDSKSAQQDTPESVQTSESTLAEVKSDSKPATVKETPEGKDPEQKQEEQSYAFSELQKLQVVKLRKLAEGLEGISLSKPATVEEVPERKEPELKQEEQSYAFSELQKLQVVKLRRLAEGLEGISLSKQAINTATKKKLIEAILNVTK